MQLQIAFDRAMGQLLKARLDFVDLVYFCVLVFVLSLVVLEYQIENDTREN